jgi:hypothetical protein
VIICREVALKMKRESRAARAVPLGIGLATVVLLLLAGVAVSARAAQPAVGPAVSIVSDASGEKLQVDGKDFMVYGMNWGWMPIGQNYMYVLWNQPDDVIKDALARDMPLLQEMGVNAIRQGSDTPPRWVRYIYENYGIVTVDPVHRLLRPENARGPQGRRRGPCEVL